MAILDGPWQIANDLLAAAASGLDGAPWGAPARRYVAVGVPAHDDCCEGQLTVSFLRTFPSARFPNIDDRPVVCQGALTAIDFAVELVRCAPTFGPNGEAPSVEALMQSAYQQALEKRAVWLAVRCLLGDRSELWSSIIREHADITPEGMCVGSVLLGTIGFIDGCACE